MRSLPADLPLPEGQRAARPIRSRPGSRWPRRSAATARASRRTSCRCRWDRRGDRRADVPSAPAAAQTYGLARPLQVLGKLAWPAAIVLGQALVMVAMLTLLLDLKVAVPRPFVATVITASLSFLAIVFPTDPLVRRHRQGARPAAAGDPDGRGRRGDADRAGLALLPGDPPWLPLTWVVKALRASLFSAYDGQWLMHWAVVAGCGGGIGAARRDAGRALAAGRPAGLPARHRVRSNDEEHDRVRTVRAGQPLPSAARPARTTPRPQAPAPDSRAPTARHATGSCGSAATASPATSPTAARCRALSAPAASRLGRAAARGQRCSSHCASRAGASLCSRLREAQQRHLADLHRQRLAERTGQRAGWTAIWRITSSIGSSAMTASTALRLHRAGLASQAALTSIRPGR